MTNDTQAACNGEANMPPNRPLMAACTASMAPTMTPVNCHNQRNLTGACSLSSILSRLR